MNKSEYAKYQAAVANGLRGLTAVSTGACAGCVDCGLPDEPSDKQRDLANEPSFSWSACDCCGSRLGGNRHPAHGLVDGKHLCHLQVCEDCLYYINYGQLDDIIRRGGQVNASPLPWKLARSKQSHELYVCSGQTEPVWSATVIKAPGTDICHEANAELIVRAVNAHELLVSALKEVEAILCSDFPDDLDTCQTIIRKAKQALAAVEEAK